ncbi:MAG: hypothetical protein K8T25_12865 [Planctomycetia bacterium]|nr:hypothetical protein [Planctomycetia bacterium]
MQASRFNEGDFDDKRTETIAAKIIAAATSLKIHMHRRADDTVMMDYELEGSFGVGDEDDGWPTVDSDEAKATARELMRAFLGK